MLQRLRRVIGIAQKAWAKILACISGGVAALTFLWIVWNRLVHLRSPDVLNILIFVVSAIAFVLTVSLVSAPNAQRKIASWASTTRVQIAILVICIVAGIALWPIWQPRGLDQPSAGFAQSIGVGVDEAPRDTRVFFNFDAWNGYGRPTLEIVLGNSRTKPARMAHFRVEFEGGLLDSKVRECAKSRAAPNVCLVGSGTVTQSASKTLGTVLSGTFLTTGFTRLQLSPRLGDARNGPYRSLYEQFQPATTYAYPPGGVEVEISTGVESNQVRYDTFFPGQPNQLRPDGWEWLLASPGGPIGAHITDTAGEERFRRRSEVAGLVLGILFALFVQIAYELVRAHAWDSRVAERPD